MKALSLLIILVFFASCGTVQERVQVKSMWYEVLDAYEARLDKCFDDDGYNAALDGCEVDSAEKRKVQPVLLSYKQVSQTFADNPEFASCTMARAIVDLLPHVSQSLGESFIPPAIEAYCGTTVSDVDLLFAESQAEVENE